MSKSVGLNIIVMRSIRNMRPTAPWSYRALASGWTLPLNATVERTSGLWAMRSGSRTCAANDVQAENTNVQTTNMTINNLERMG